MNKRTVRGQPFARTDRYSVSTKVYFLLWLLAVICSCPCKVIADTDPIDELLKQKPTADPNMIEYVETLISTHKAHPRILELRFFKTGQLMGSSQDPEHFRSVIAELKKLANDAGDTSDLNFDCRMRVGEILFHCLRDKQAAYEQYKSLEHHPVLATHDLKTDYRRVELYVRIAQSALPYPVRKKDEVEKYARLAMAYPYLGMKDRKMYRKFYELYEEAGRLFITAFDGNPGKLMSIEIYPSHPRLWKYRKQAIEQTLNLDELREEILDPNHLADVSIDVNEQSSIQKITEPSALKAREQRKTANDVNITENKTSAKVTLSPSNTHLGIWIAGGTVLSVIVIAATVFILKSRAR